MTRDLKYWSDNCAGVFWLAALTLGVMLLVGGAPGALAWMLGLLALGSLAGWTICAFKLASRSTIDKVFPRG